MGTTCPHKHVQIPENLFLPQDHFPLIFYLKLLSISGLVVADIDTQSILSMVYINIQKYCGRVDLYVDEWILEATRPHYECL